MKAAIHTVALLGLALGMLTSVAMPSDAWAKSHKAHPSHARAKHQAKMSPAKQAQTHLANLGYYAGQIDGQIGSKTKAAIRAFQKDQGLKPTGAVNASLLATLSAADRSHAMASLPLTRRNGKSRYGEVFDLKDIINGIGATEEDNTPQKDYDASRPDFYGYYEQELSDVASSYDTTGDGIGGGTSHPLVSRFARLDVIEGTDQGKRRYTVMLNERPILLAENQPTVIGISRTFRLGTEDAIIFSAYNGDGSACGFRHYLLSMRDGASQLLKIGNCTRGYQAHIANNSLFIVFPEADDGRLVGATWRYERGNVTRL